MMFDDVVKSWCCQIFHGTQNGSFLNNSKFPVDTDPRTVLKMMADVTRGIVDVDRGCDLDQFWDDSKNRHFQFTVSWHLMNGLRAIETIEIDHF